MVTVPCHPGGASRLPRGSCTSLIPGSGSMWPWNGRGEAQLNGYPASRAFWIASCSASMRASATQIQHGRAIEPISIAATPAASRADATSTFRSTGSTRPVTAVSDGVGGVVVRLASRRRRGDND